MRLSNRTHWTLSSVFSTISMACLARGNFTPFSARRYRMRSPVSNDIEVPSKAIPALHLYSSHLLNEPFTLSCLRTYSFYSRRVWQKELRSSQLHYLRLAKPCPSKASLQESRSALCFEYCLGASGGYHLRPAKAHNGSICKPTICDLGLRGPFLA